MESNCAKPSSGSHWQVTQALGASDVTTTLFPEIIPIRGRDASGPRLLPTRTFRGEAVNEEGGGGGGEVCVKGAEGAVGGGRVGVLVLEVLTCSAFCLQERPGAAMDRGRASGSVAHRRTLGVLSSLSGQKI